MTNRRAVLLHINPMEGITPLPGGYMKTFAELEPELRSNWDIQIGLATGKVMSSQPISLQTMNPVWLKNVGYENKFSPGFGNDLPKRLYAKAAVVPS